jgi:hypothetical protein
MAENGGIPSTGGPRVDAALERIRGKFQDLEDAMVVQAHLEKRMSEQIMARTEWLAAHQAANEKFDVKMAEIEEKINFLIDREMRREGGPESRQ